MVCLSEMRAARTSGEFALQLGSGAGIDYEGLCGRLHSFSQKLRSEPLDPCVLPETEANELLADMEAMRARLEYQAAQDPGPAAALAVRLPDPWELLHLREDHTVDFDTAMSEANKAARFSHELWERLNGVQHGPHSEPMPAAPVAQAELGVGHARAERLLARAAEVLEAELERASVAEWDVSGAQLRLSVAELALLEQQSAAGEDDLERDVEEFAARLGIIESKEPRRWLEQNLEKAKVGFAFYTVGGQLLWQDIQYAADLVSRAAFLNYTLKPREVRTLHRAVKDVVVLVPFLIILLIPLSPIGHVLVFSFIQKFFPDFFPSTFTERRQNAVKIYKDIVPEADTAA